MTSPSDRQPVLDDLTDGARSALGEGLIPSSGVLVLVAINEVDAAIVKVGKDATTAWYHFTRNLIAEGQHPSDLLWGVVLAYEDVKQEQEEKREGEG